MDISGIIKNIKSEYIVPNNILSQLDHLATKPILSFNTAKEFVDLLEANKLSSPELYIQLCQAFPEKPQTHIKAIKYFLRNKMIPLAYSHIKNAKQKFDEHKVIFLLEIKYNHLIQDWRTSLKLLNELLRLYPEAKEAYFIKVKTLLKLNKRDRAIQVYHKCKDIINKNQCFKIQEILHHHDEMKLICQAEVSEDPASLPWKIKLLKTKILAKDSPESIEKGIKELSNFDIEELNELAPVILKTSEINLEYLDQFDKLLESLEHFIIEEETPYKILEEHEVELQPDERVFDAVYTWLNSDDPIFLEKYISTTGIDPNTSKDQQKNKDRLQDHGEIILSLLSLQLYCKEVRNIYIVTPNQKFDTDSFSEEFAEKIIFVDQDDLLPDHLKGKIFNSTIIEAYLCKINGLSNTFLYFCDDYLLGQELNSEDIFTIDDIPKVNMRQHDFIPYSGISKLPRKLVPHIIPTMYLENARSNFVDQFDVEPQLMHPHQMMIMNRKACLKTLDLFEDSWNESFYLDFTRGRNTVHTLLLMNWVAIYLGLQKLNADYQPKVDSIVFHNGLSQENVNFLKTKPPKFICINNLPNDSSVKYFKDLLIHYQTMVKAQS